MGKAARHFIKRTASRFNIGITTAKHLEELEELNRAYASLDSVLGFAGARAIDLLVPLRASKSQLRQDIFVLSELGLKREGFFVEFGATDGVYLSNTHMLEQQFGWTGILAEPARCWHRALRTNRSCTIETACVWRDSGATLEFNEVEEKELSTVNSYSSSDLHALSRKEGKRYEVKTISLLDLLDKHAAPKSIDYLSIDTEGSEYDILSSFDFSRYRFRVITCEHNFSPQREQIFSLLTQQGFIRKFEQYSQFDDWYVDTQFGSAG
jgi:FkbM family methyltransferase